MSPVNQSMTSTATHRFNEPEKPLKRHDYQLKEYRPVKRQISPQRSPDLYKAPLDEVPKKKRAPVEDEVPVETGPYRDPLKDYGWKTKKRTAEQAYTHNQESDLFKQRYSEDQVKYEMRERKPTNFEKEMGMVEDDRPK